MDRKNIEINPLLETYGEYIKKIDQALEKELDLYSESEFIEPLKYSLEGGKRIRPIILSLAAESIGKIDENVLAASCAVEFLHMESIIHDDIIDNETMRRQKEPFHVKYGYNTSVLTGDFVLGLILAISSRLDNARITKDLATTAMLMSEGEIIEGRLEESGDITFDDYLKVIEYKTATAFEVAARIGGIVANGTEEQKEMMVDLFSQLGEAIIIDESLMAAATVLGASGIAYAMRFIRAASQGGIEIGFGAQISQLIAAQTVKGAASLLMKTGNHPEHEIDKVTTPKGCTIAGLNEMEHNGFSSAFIKGITVSANKAKNLYE